MPPDDVLGQAELQAQRADFVLEQVAQRLDQLEAQVRGQAADVVVQLDRGGRAVGARRRFRSRRDRACPGPGSGRLRSWPPRRLKHSMKAWPMRRRFSCGSVTPASAVEKLVLGLDDVQVGVEVVGELLDDRRLLRPCAAGRCRPGCRRAAGRWPGRAAPRRPTNRRRPRARKSRGRCRRARGSAAIGLLGEVAQLPGARAAADRASRKLPRILRAERRVRHLGMKLQAVDRQRRGA